MFCKQKHQDGGSRILRESNVQYARLSGNLPMRNLAAALLYLILVIKSSANCGWLQHSMVRREPLKLQRNNARSCITDVCVRV